MTAQPSPLGIDAGLLARFRSAGGSIVWRPAFPRPKGRSPSGARIAHLHDEEARVETRRLGRTTEVTVDSGPVGALVLLLEADRRGPPSRLEAIDAGAAAGFSVGAIRAGWGPSPRARGSLTIHDLAELARYALT